jgi:hypothetical protein
MATADFEDRFEVGQFGHSAMPPVPGDDGKGVWFGTGKLGLGHGFVAFPDYIRQSVQAIQVGGGKDFVQLAKVGVKNDSFAGLH